MIFFSFFLVAFVKSYEAIQMQNKCEVSKNEFHREIQRNTKYRHSNKILVVTFFDQ